MLLEAKAALQIHKGSAKGLLMHFQIIFLTTVYKVLLEAKKLKSGSPLISFTLCYANNCWFVIVGLLTKSEPVELIVSLQIK